MAATPNRKRTPPPNRSFSDGLKQIFKRRLGRFDPAAEEDGVDAEAEHSAAEVFRPFGEGGVHRDGAPVFAVAFAGGGDFFVCVPQFGAFPLGEHAEHLREIARADEQQIHSVDGGDPFALFQGAEGFDLNRHKRIAVGVIGQLRQRLSAVVGVVAAGVEAAVAPGGEFGPLHKFFRMLSRFNPSRHQTASAGLQIRGGLGIANHRHPYKAIHIVRPAASRRERDLLVTDGGVLLIDPKAVKTAAHADDIEDHGMDNATRAQNAAHFAASKHLFKRFGHGRLQ